MSIIDHPIKPIPKTPKPKKTKFSMKTLFGAIWDERIHLCCNCYGKLGREAKAWFFSHTKPKSTHPELKHTKDNIDLRCFTCHTLHDHHNTKAYEARNGVNAGKDTSGFGSFCP